MMLTFRRRRVVPVPEGVDHVQVRHATAKEAGEHDELETLHTALSAQKRAHSLALYAERLETDAMQALDEARKGMRRIAEQR